MTTLTLDEMPGVIGPGKGKQTVDALRHTRTKREGVSSDTVRGP
jgi:hypothetical protein